MSQISVRRYDVREYTGRIEDVKAAIIEADPNLIGLGLWDLGWPDFLEAVEYHGYTRVTSEWVVNDVRVQTWRRVTDAEAVPV